MWCSRWADALKGTTSTIKHATTNSLFKSCLLNLTSNRAIREPNLETVKILLISINLLFTMGYGRSQESSKSVVGRFRSHCPIPFPLLANLCGYLSSLRGLFRDVVGGAGGENALVAAYQK